MKVFQPEYYKSEQALHNQFKVISISLNLIKKELKGLEQRLKLLEESEREKEMIKSLRGY